MGPVLKALLLAAELVEAGAGAFPGGRPKPETATHRWQVRLISPLKAELGLRGRLSCGARSCHRRLFKPRRRTENIE
jgi:hypothetical protein